ncbi:response regulator [Cellulosilyticum sp. I15G10I2]|uniref:response regulator n=1 Tax=Cellulosilyticum sp. I15G10I2 TaxID=1892843 RepID=UPI00085C705C|nr:response regulator [Cellulosilyticum sp. I15G10I2]
MPKVLIVDDTAFMRLSIKIMLEKGGFQIVGEAENGKEAVKKYIECKPDIVTMDITMPEMSGIDAMIAIKEYDKQAKVVIVSAMGQEHLVKNAIINGAASFIIKPFREDDIVQILNKVIAKA